MTVAELIAKLKQMPQDAKVTISDGYNCYFYEGSYSVEAIEEYNSETESMRRIVDIGIGGTMIE